MPRDWVGRACTGEGPVQSFLPLPAGRRTAYYCGSSSVAVCCSTLQARYSILHTLHYTAVCRWCGERPCHCERIEGCRRRVLHTTELPVAACASLLATTASDRPHTHAAAKVVCHQEHSQPPDSSYDCNCDCDCIMADGDKEKAAEADSTPIVAKSEKDRQQAEAQPQPQPQPNNEQEPNAAQQSSKGGGAAAASEEEGRRRRQAFLRQASLPSFNARKPRLVHCWLHGSDGAKIWSAFGPRDSRALEKAWQTWQCETNGGSSARGNEERGKEFTSGEEADGIRGSDGADGEETKIGAANAKHARSNAQGEDPVPSDSSSRSDNLLSPPDPDVPLPTWRVPVMEDHLFEVDLRNMRLWSVFWKTKPSEVMRARWFFDSPKISPCTDAVASELDSLYDSIQPWLSSYADELRSSVALGSDAEDKLKAPLTTLKGSYVIFLGPSLARIYSDDVSSRITKTLWTTWSGAHNGGTLVARGFDVAQNLLQTQESNGTSTPTRNAKRASTAVKRTADSKGAHTPTRSIDSSKTEAVANEEGSDGTQTPKEDSSIQQTGAAKPNIGSDEAEEASKQDCDSKEANNNADTYSADAMRSWVTSKFGSWAASAASPNVSEQMSGKTQKDIKEAFHEAQSRAQGYMHDQQRRTMERDLARDKVVSEQMAEAMDTAAVADGEETAQPAHTEEEEYQREVGLDNEPLDLVLVWHGIGQKIAEEWKSLDFTLAVTNLRNLTRKRAGLAPPSDVGGKGLSELTKGRRVQMLPVMWRATLEDFEPTARDGDAHPDEHLDNNFTIDDIFSDTMPIIKQLISGVLFDIPLYLSHHREEIMSRVVRENNRIVRLFLQRNPRFFDNGGRISLIAHSLGAALATDV